MQRRSTQISLFVLISGFVLTFVVAGKATVVGEERSGTIEAIVAADTYLCGTNPCRRTEAIVGQPGGDHVRVTFERSVDVGDRVTFCFIDTQISDQFVEHCFAADDPEMERNIAIGLVLSLAAAAGTYLVGRGRSHARAQGFEAVDHDAMAKRHACFTESEMEQVEQWVADHEAFRAAWKRSEHRHTITMVLLFGGLLLLQPLLVWRSPLTGTITEAEQTGSRSGWDLTIDVPEHGAFEVNVRASWFLDRNPTSALADRLDGATIGGVTVDTTTRTFQPNPITFYRPVFGPPRIRDNTTIGILAAFALGIADRVARLLSRRPTKPEPLDPELFERLSALDSEKQLEIV